MARVKTLAGKAIAQHDSPNKGGAMSGHKGVVLHIAEGSYLGTISWQMNPDQRYGSGESVTTCSTFIVGKNRGEWAQMVDTDLIAWCQRDGSRTWLSVELAGKAPEAPTEWQIEACAQILAWSHRQYGHPIAIAVDPSQRGLGHHSMDREWLGEEWGHDSCPGSGVIAAKQQIVNRAKSIVDGTENPMGAMQDRDVAIALWRMEALVVGRDKVASGPTKDEPVWIVQAIKALSTKMDTLLSTVDDGVEEILAKPQVEAAPVDAATLKAVLLDPQVLAAIAMAVADEQSRRLTS